MPEDRVRKQPRGTPEDLVNMRPAQRRRTFHHRSHRVIAQAAAHPCADARLLDCYVSDGPCLTNRQRQ